MNSLKFLKLVTVFSVLTAAVVCAHAKEGGNSSGGGGGFCSSKGCVILSQVLSDADFAKLKLMNDPVAPAAQKEKPSGVTYWQPSKEVVAMVTAIARAQPLTQSEQDGIIEGVDTPHSRYKGSKKTVTTYDGFGRVASTTTYDTTYEVPDQIEKRDVEAEIKKYRAGYAGLKDMSKFKLFAYRKPWWRGDVLREGVQTVLLPEFFKIKSATPEQGYESQALLLIHEYFQRSNYGELSVTEVGELDGYVLRNYRAAQTGTPLNANARFNSLYFGLSRGLDTKGPSYYAPPSGYSVQSTGKLHSEAESFLAAWVRQHRGPIDLSKLMNVSYEDFYGDTHNAMTSILLRLDLTKVDDFLKAYPEFKAGMPWNDFLLMGDPSFSPNAMTSEKERYTGNLNPQEKAICGTSKGLFVFISDPRIDRVDFVDCSLQFATALIEAEKRVF